jgi:DNA-binding CsgD family transcriptional regulator
MIRQESIVTKREREVVELVAEGLSREQIAGRLCISKRTVDSHCYNVTKRLSLSSDDEVVRYVMGKT